MELKYGIRYYNIQNQKWRLSQNSLLPYCSLLNIGKIVYVSVNIVNLLFAE